jgi:hypothetical protein
MTIIQLRRGLEKEIPVLAQGEPAFTTDTGKLFIGSPSGNVLIFGGNGSSNNILPNNQGWVSSSNQDTFQISNGQIVNAKLLTVYVSGVVQPTITLINNTTFQLPEPLSDGINVFATWFEAAIPVTTGHHTSHESGGQDEIDITKLKNYDKLHDVGNLVYLMQLFPFKYSFSLDGMSIGNITLPTFNVSLGTITLTN